MPDAEFIVGATRQLDAFLRRDIDVHAERIEAEAHRELTGFPSSSSSRIDVPDQVVADRLRSLEDNSDAASVRQEWKNMIAKGKEGVTQSGPDTNMSAITDNQAVKNKITDHEEGPRTGVYYDAATAYMAAEGPPVTDGSMAANVEAGWKRLGQQKQGMKAEALSPLQNKRGRPIGDGDVEMGSTIESPAHQPQLPFAVTSEQAMSDASYFVKRTNLQQEEMGQRLQEASQVAHQAVQGRLQQTEASARFLHL